MSDSTIENLSQEGQFESAGGFTLDPAKAREKLKQYQFPDSEGFLVFLVAAGVASGASQIDVHTTASASIVSFDGVPLTRDDLENLQPSLFLGKWDRLRELAIGLNTALVAHPAVEIKGASDWLLRATPGAGEQFERCDRTPTTRITVRETFISSLKRLLGGTQPPELRALQKRCQDSGVPILVNGNPINRKIPIHEPTAALQLQGEPLLPELSAPRVWGAQRRVQGFSAWLLLGAHETHELTIVVNGVTYSTSWGEPLSALVVVSHLPRDLTYRSLVRDSKEYLSLIERLKAGRIYLQCQICREWRDGQLNDPQQRFFSSWIERWLGAGKKDPDDPGLQAVADLPYFPLAGTDRLASLSELKQGRVLITHAEWDLPPLGDELVIRVRGTMQSTLTGIFGTLRNGDSVMQKAADARKNRWEFSARPRQLPILEPTGVAVQKVDLGDWNGEIGWTRSSGRLPPAALTFLKNGRLLGSRTYSWQEGLPPGLVGVLDNPELVPNAEWTDVLPQQSALVELPARLQATLIEASLALLQLEAEPWRNQALIGCLAVLGPHAPNQLQQAPLFELHLGTRASYQAILQQCERLGHLPTTGRRWPIGPLNGASVLLVEPWLRSMLLALFPRNQEDYEPELRDAVRSDASRLQWLEQPPVPACLPATEAYWARAPLPSGGEVGVPVGPLSARTRVDVYRQQRPLGQRVVDQRSHLPPGLRVALVDEDGPVDLDWSRLPESNHDDVWVERVRDAFPALLESMTANFPPQSQDRERAQQMLFRVLSQTPPERIPPQALEADCLDGLDGRSVSLAQVLERPVEALVLAEPPLAWDHHESALWLTPSVYQELTSWMGPTNFLVLNSDYQSWLEHRDMLTREPQEARLDGQLFWREPIEEAGEIGLGPAAGCPPLHVDLQLLFEHRPVARLSLPIGELGLTPLTTHGSWRCRAILDCPDLNFDGAAVRRDATWERLTGDVRKRARQVGFAEAPRLPSLPQDEREQLLAYLWRQLVWEVVQPPGPSALQLDAPLFPLLDGSWTSLRTLRQRSGRIPYAFSAGPPDPEIVLVRRELLSVFRVIFGHTNIVEQGAVPNLEAHRPVDVRLERAPDQRLQLQPGQSFNLTRDQPVPDQPIAPAPSSLARLESLLVRIIPDLKLSWQRRIERLSVYKIGLKTVVQLNPEHPDWAPLQENAAPLELAWAILKILVHLPADPGPNARARHARLNKIVQELVLDGQAYCPPLK